MAHSTPSRTIRFQKHLGAGVFGNVYKVYDVATGSMYAAKMTKYNAGEPKKGLNEIQILKYIQHHKDAQGGENLACIVRRPSVDLLAPRTASLGPRKRYRRNFYDGGIFPSDEFKTIARAKRPKNGSYGISVLNRF